MVETVEYHKVKKILSKDTLAEVIKKRQAIVQKIFATDVIEK